MGCGCSKIQTSKNKGKMSKPKVLLTIGAGPGISAATARKFGANGYKVALVSLKQEEAEKEKEALAALGVEAIALEADASDAAAVTKAIAAAKDFGPIHAVHYNAFGLAGGEDEAEFLKCCAVGCVGLITAKKELLADLKAVKGSILVTSSFVASTALPDGVEEFVAGLGLVGYCAGKAAQDRVVTQMAITLKDDIFVGKVVVAGKVKGTAFDAGDAKIEPDSIAEAFWKMNEEREAKVATVADPE